ncbi:MAG: tetraacyldisaccharide 4'-kinase [Alphaproteobacteria bacterium RIFCSPLOWO2_01_FULL_45_8]|nr:MAG: tetraacyldisaccharide 4'-kinase [Alphaproteobacteria bacterium GWB1_45_5]OFW76312.1 MAG: tetraacyldisaccharide 4'-kinase [Alphaproteobacteria bacterium GWA1_45_9]OFW89416.1 MAG: tetraacyldisaccharide 4'-kinase [Alphaproteobacteria bacterium RIFCSPHIGHO2_01_FULL_41_14]OFW95612.1 MAG: tetraacyldisaccharide 4'-kinase [Alphaproteobacteria bacterium RIFCSPLOWO2_01_FULL_45_8]HCI48689.1 tetraacyldisaccharide 4'-kinase [Holosporales bacterium]
MIRPPQFWENPLPFYWRPWAWVSMIYGWVIQHRLKNIVPTKVPVPVICVGNLTLGGTGKTPVSLFLATYFLKKGKKVGFLTRGYKGKSRGPLRVNTHHTAKEVGDEPLLLARVAPTWVARDRVLGAREMVRKGIDIIIMDDGHQNPFLYKDVSLVVVDGVQGFGNKEVFPLGPLREPLHFGLSRAEGVVIVRSPSHALKKDLVAYEGIVTEANIIIKKDSLPFRKVMAFCGIGNPDKFFTSLEEAGIEIVERKSFPDHYRYRGSDLKSLKKMALSHHVDLVTTEKDWVRLSKQDQKDILPVPLTLKWKEWAKMEKLITQKIPK